MRKIFFTQFIWNQCSLVRYNSSKGRVLESQEEGKRGGGGGGQELKK